MKNVVMIAFDCNPYGESEGLIAWNLAYYMSKIENVIMITRYQFKDLIEKKCLEENIDIEFKYVSDEKIHKKFNDATGIRKYLILNKYISSFFRLVLKELKIIESKQHIDVIHRITPNSYRKTINLSSFKNTIKIMGPCGGAQETPKELQPFLSKKELFKEKAHFFVNVKTIHSMQFKRAIKSFDKVLCVNQETYGKLASIVELNKLKLFTEVGINQISTSDYRDEVFQILWIGRMIYRKGLSFLVDCLSELVKRNVKFHLRIIGDGDEFQSIQELVKQKELNNYVSFLGRIPHERINDFYLTSNLFVFPSYRESTGCVLAEALENSIPIVSFDLGGASTIITDKDCLVNVSNKDKNQIIIDFASTIEKFIINQEFYKSKKTNSTLIARPLLWENKIEEIHKLYEASIK